VLKGAGRHFQAGADLSFLDHLRTVSPEENHEFSRRTVGAIRGLQLFSRRTVGLVQRGCFGGGVGIAAACDIAVATEDAIFALTAALTRRRGGGVARRPPRAWPASGKNARRNGIRMVELVEQRDCFASLAMTAKRVVIARSAATKQFRWYTACAGSAQGRGGL